MSTLRGCIHAVSKIGRGAEDRTQERRRRGSGWVATTLLRQEGGDVKRSCGQRQALAPPFLGCPLFCMNGSFNDDARDMWGVKRVGTHSTREALPYDVTPDPISKRG
eukprot:5548281-Prymnesium_polylepis.1